jgi:hypothetical protein
LALRGRGALALTFAASHVYLHPEALAGTRDGGVNAAFGSICYRAVKLG